jgi:hypothetical protein
LRIDIQQVIKYGDTFFSATDTAYLIFLVIGIIGYFTVPSVANYIVQASGANALLYKASTAFTGGARASTSTTIAGTTALGTFVSYLQQSQPQVPTATTTPKSDDFQHDKLSGKT